VRFFRLRLFVITVAIFGCPLLNGHAADERKLTGREAGAVALAVNTFQAEHRKEPKFYGDLKHYSVSVERRGNQMEVAFIPDPSPKPKLAKNEYWLEFGSTVYGTGVTYLISLDRMKILKETYMR
jgi:hypothetical protein